MATSYRLQGGSIQELCDHNHKVSSFGLVDDVVEFLSLCVHAGCTGIGKVGCGSNMEDVEFVVL